MKISDYMPKLYKNNGEMLNIINSEEIEFETGIKNSIDSTFNNTFAILANAEGIRRYEKLLEIPLDENKDNLEYRRARVLAKLGTAGVLTYKWLENNLLSLVGKDNYQLYVNNLNYILTINIADIYKNTANTLYNIYRPLIPSNLELNVNLFQEVLDSTIFVTSIIQEGDIIFIKGEE